jgi:DNA-binding HxlR family transcriptional regulator
LGLEDLLGLRVRVRVLRVLALWDGLNMGRIGRLTGLSWHKLDKMLRELVEEGILQESKYPSSSSRYVRMFRYANTPKARILKRLFQEWETATPESLLTKVNYKKV